MKNKKVMLRTGNLAEATKEFIDIWHQTEQNKIPQATIEKISFSDQSLLFKTLTPKRFEILQYVHETNGISIRALAKALGRDYSNVHQDVKILHQLALMLKNEENNNYYVPWDAIVTEISLSKPAHNKSGTTTTRAAHS